MATFGALIRGLSSGIARGIRHGDLPPVGEKIVWRGKPQPLPDYKGFDAYWVDSGTSALALTMIAAKQLRPEIAKPQVILPAYGCPDLVAAAVYANVQPVLVDIQADDPGYDLEQLKSAINSNTIAVVAVNFLGISDRLKAIKALLPNNTYLIEDNAQCYAALAEPEKIMGDFAITSFGRGKPVSLLGGGLALIRKPLNNAHNNLEKNLNLERHISESQKPKLLKVKIALYNVLLTPQLYLWINRCPLIKLGETHYHPLHTITQLDSQRAALLSSNIEKHINRQPYRKQEQEHNEEDNKEKVLDLADTLKERTTKLLRHPILVNDTNSRDRLIKKSEELGLGCSTMYQTALINIASIKGLVKLHSTKNAEILASKLITLPCKQSHHHQKQLAQLIAPFQKQ
ncbi:DegT/DnrJ/EryC1/StrS family aminotransferase [Dasania marina]|uniref:DegT/DnrJ/EryC1/StrS family aminotransferase n=1 Tax=Dasania marina TaxID=471499 RepID=UPI0030DD3503|tara:strand:- start:97903 stop:99105 length:1203 start_codon:yes stop_codon:yes gene_type:complete